MLKLARSWQTTAIVGIWILAVMLSVSLMTVEKIRQGDWMWGWQELQLTGISPDQGTAYLARTERPELSSHEHPSAAQILEDGRPLGPSHAQHWDIRKLGRGQFSFWHDYVLPLIV